MPGLNLVLVREELVVLDFQRLRVGALQRLPDVVVDLLKDRDLVVDAEEQLAVLVDGLKHVDRHDHLGLKIGNYLVGRVKFEVVLVAFQHFERDYRVSRIRIEQIQAQREKLRGFLEKADFACLFFLLRDCGEPHYALFADDSGEVLGAADDC